MSRSGRTRFVMVCAVWTCSLALSPQPASAQLDKYSWGKPAVKVSAPAPKSSGRARRPAPKRTLAPLLMLKYRILKVERDGTMGDTNPNAVFYDGDWIRLGVTANQSGYLYIIRQMENKEGRVTEPPVLIFPDSRINGGSNLVQKEVEFLLPASAKDLQAPLREGEEAEIEVMTLKPPAGRDVLWLVFSRNLITDLPEKITAQGPQTVDPNYVNGLKSFPAQKLARASNAEVDFAKGESPYVILVMNQDSKENQTLVEKIVLRHDDRPANPGAQ